MNKKGIELPMSTIVIIIMVILVLAAVGITFFNQFSSGNKGFDSAQCTQMCTTIRANMAVNDNTVWDKNYWNKSYNPNANPIAVSFCNGGCDKTTDCWVRDSAGESITDQKVLTTAKCS